MAAEVYASGAGHPPAALAGKRGGEPSSTEVAPARVRKLRPALRRTQAERRAATRDALVRATVESLVERGYAHTTTQEVQRRAGVSRGALTHQFTSKGELMLAAVDHLYEEFSCDVRAAAADLPAEPGTRIRLGVELVWERFHGPLFVAAMELWGAARTDPELRAALLPHERRLGVALRGLTMEVFGERMARHRHGEAVYQVLLTSMRGQALTYALQPDAPRTGPHLQHWIAVVEAVMRSPDRPAESPGAVP